MFYLTLFLGTFHGPNVSNITSNFMGTLQIFDGIILSKFVGDLRSFSKTAVDI